MIKLSIFGFSNLEIVFTFESYEVTLHHNCRLKPTNKFYVYIVNFFHICILNFVKYLRNYAPMLN